jgi:hypothetical protein
MATFTPRLGLTLPAGSEDYNVTVANGNSVLLDADLGGVTICTSVTRPSTTYAGMLAFETDTGMLIIRDGANTGWILGTTVATCTSVTRPTSTHAGMLIYETDTQCLVMRNSANSGWIVRLGGQTYYQTINDSTTTTATSYGVGTGGGAMPGIAFIAPPTGEVLLHYSCGMTTNSAAAAGTVYYAPRVRNGSAIGLGTDFFTPSDNDAISHAGHLFRVRYGGHRMVPSLTPGAAFNVQMNVKVFGAATGTFDSKKLIIQPA